MHGDLATLNLALPPLNTASHTAPPALPLFSRSFGFKGLGLTTPYKIKYRLSFQNNFIHARFQVLTAGSMKFRVF
jgi:hypothetical protein